VVLNKIDLAPYVEFSMNALREGIARLNAGVKLFELSCRTGEGIGPWAEWLAALVRARKS
jgi:hydrogenase nickel incorporation protein HypB